MDNWSELKIDNYANYWNSVTKEYDGNYSYSVKYNGSFKPYSLDEKFHVRCLLKK